MDLSTNNETTKTNKIYNKWYFNTLTFTQFAELGNAFYPLNSNNKRSSPQGGESEGRRPSDLK